MLNFAELIKESASDLQTIERKESRSTLQTKIRMLRLLKSGHCRSFADVSVSVGISVAHARRLFSEYRKVGFSSFIEWRYAGGNQNKLSPAAKADVIERGKRGFTSQHEAQEYIERTHNCRYTQSGISRLFSGLKIKNKTARPHRQR